jgi:ABC-type transporter MlaC component
VRCDGGIPNQEFVMKLSTLTAALLLAATPVAFAQSTAPQNDTIGKKADRVFDRAEDATSRTVNPPAGEPSLGQKAGRVFDRMEQGTGRMVDKARGTSPEQARVEPSRSDSTTMGAPADPYPARR